MTAAAVDRTQLYRSADGQRIEHARSRSGESGTVADGTIVGLHAGRPLRARYEVTCDSRRHVRNVSVETLAPDRAILSMGADEDGIWRRVDGGVLDVPLFHCLDVAIELTPVTAGLTIGRLGLALHEAAIVNVVSIALPELRVRRIEHRFTALALDPGGGLYRQEDFDSGRRSTVRLDAGGGVIAIDDEILRMWPAAPDER